MPKATDLLPHNWMIRFALTISGTGVPYKVAECFISCPPRKAAHSNFIKRKEIRAPSVLSPNYQSCIFLSVKQYLEDTVTSLCDILLSRWFSICALFSLGDVFFID